MGNVTLKSSEPKMKKKKKTKWDQEKQCVDERTADSLPVVIESPGQKAASHRVVIEAPGQATASHGDTQDDQLPSPAGNESEDTELAVALAVSKAEAEARDREICSQWLAATDDRETTAAGEVPVGEGNDEDLKEALELVVALAISQVDAGPVEVTDKDSTVSTQQNQSQSGERISSELQCPVCLEMFSRATTLGCGHTFCAGCLQEAREDNRDQCPMCRAAITSVSRCVALDNIVQSLVQTSAGSDPSET